MSSDMELDPVPELTQPKQSRVLMVGAGGIGCELLKNLVLTGFGEVHVVDLDTIDLSNLNRQFLFRQEHIKKSKALVAKEVAEKFNPAVKIVAHHANIKDAEFSIAWFSSFRIVFNALDNLEARRHVNKMCLAADVPLIESGTTGFNGQVQVIKKGVTACYDCSPKETPKSFPVCTIRSTPSQPIHCIVWGKSYLLNEIFGTSEDESAFDHSSDAENAQEIAELKRESEALRRIRDSVGNPEFHEMLFNKVFNTDIVRLRSMEDMWKSRKPPEPLDYKDLLEKAKEALASKEAVLKDDQKVWSLEENLVVLNDSLDRLSKRVLDMKNTGDGPPDAIITFDKDDEDTLDFVAASANIRSTLFGIDRKSKFDIKQMAGNIIPAIATTNAIVARSLCPRGVQLQLGYGEREISVSNEVGILYDPDETDNLGKKLSELGIKPDSFLTITDEDDEDPKEPLDDKPIRGISSGEVKIPTKPKKTPAPEANGRNGHGVENGSRQQSEGVSEVVPAKRPHPEDSEDIAVAKKAKTVASPAAKDDDIVVLDHPAGGAIVIDDD
ncbi:hypothetical protein CHGG_08058 [Chaetomium globosum CBS 148.51]|uniref:Ubiquitin-activating enzyme E1-like n=1 Tax=Chaetomium globosum (strain ATCC 6205 / CBS 148.51 / DSM 1962 / NBRC 6347 / NRRL 1970) TaxID=306901 RepID=Q2GVE6_CHAGB|nr:uncharacterized protein CHGG_08058 [Chaetomium globosum CBS 148.51]EAQ86805.1 hypothetical protein CHGG_08058 [Chaetomium globosum CBS 148.51]